MSKPQSLQLSIEFLSDWHVGEGAGRPGHIDRIVRRDPLDGLPYIPAKTIIGIWRDACEQVACALDNSPVPQGQGAMGTWQRLVQEIFGEQPNQRQQLTTRIQKSRLDVRPARFSNRLRAHLAADSTAREALSLVKAGVKIDRHTGQAEDHCLRFEELIRGGAVLETSVILNDKSEHSSAMLALLWAGARVVERLGGKRRRGLGRCCWNLNGIQLTDDQLLAQLDRAAPQVPLREVQSDEDRQLATDAVGSDWTTFTVDLTPLSPVVIPQQVVGNVVESLDYIPGTQLLGAFSRSITGAISGNARQAIARGDVQVLNAYRLIAQKSAEVRGLPVPFVIFHDKLTGELNNKNGHGGPVWNRMREPDQPERQLQQHRQGYIGVDSSEQATQQIPAYHKVDLQVTTHGAIDDLPQRPTSAVGGVYSYQAIPASAGGSATYRTVIRIRKSLLNQQSMSLPDEIRLGIAKKDDYGRVMVKVVAEHPQGEKLQPSPADTSFTLWCLSPVLLRGQALRSQGGADVLCGYLSRKLNAEVAIAEPSDLISAALRPHRAEGWLDKWQLPRPSYVGIEAGSCARFKVAGIETAELRQKLRDLQAEGIGERRAEGFGEIWINPALLDAELSQLTPADPVEPITDSRKDVSPLEPGDPGFAYAQLLERVAWRRAIEQGALHLALDKFRREKLHWSSEPPNSQLGAIRSIVSTLRLQSDLARLKKWVGHLKETSRRRDKWPGEALAALGKLCVQPQLIWQWLDEVEALAFPLMTRAAVGDRRSELQEEFLMLALRTVLIAAIQTEVRLREKGDH